MRKISQHTTKEYQPMVLYLDDLQKIVDVFGDHGIKYCLNSEKFSYDNLQEIVENEQKIKSLAIKSTDPYVSIEFNSHSASVRVINDDLISTGIFHKIDSIVKKRVRFLFSKLVIGILYTVFYSLSLACTLLRVGNYISDLFLVMGTSIFIFGGHTNLNKRVIIHSFKSDNKSNFFKRKRDELTLLLIGSVITFLVTIMIRRLVK